jgi:aspartyl-tRNA(Asn)/glutamyl-tRNA(Gln) amidotransferase subunit B
MEFKTIIGLETHVELATQKKMFCGCSANYFGKNPNTQTCPVCLGLPGALPIPNQQAMKWTILLGLALNCKINRETYFERKHYFYPDLPKGYQISQYLKPLCYNGFMIIDNKKVRINRVHLEEDTGKLLHGEQFDSTDGSYIDFNRSGVPLVEIVTEPDIENSEQAVKYLKNLQLIVQYIGISTADMDKGSMRAEPNISLVNKVDWLKKQKLPNYKAEVKNINSFRFVKNAIDSEIIRQANLLENGKVPKQETRRYVESTALTEPMRSKEEAKDYRYFPEPDIPPFSFSTDFIKQIENKLNVIKLPKELLNILITEFKVRSDVALILVENKHLGEVFISTEKEVENKSKYATFLVNKKNELDLSQPKNVIATFNKTLEKVKIDTTSLSDIINHVIKSNPQAITDYKSGKTSALQFLLGKILKETGRKVDVRMVIGILKEQLEKI